DLGTKLWTLEDSRGIHTLRGMSHSGAKVAFSRDGTLLAALMNDWRVGIWDVQQKKLRHRLQMPAGFYVDNAGLQFTPDGSHFLFSAGTKMTAWDMKTGELRCEWKLPPGLADQIGVSQEGEIRLMRGETQNKTGGPFSDNPPSIDPRVIRLRVMSWDGTMTTRKTINRFPLHFHRSGTTRDGKYFVIKGVKGNGESSVLVVGGEAGHEIYELPATYPSSSSPLIIADQSNCLLQIHNDPEHNIAASLFQLNDGKRLPGLPYFCGAVEPNIRFGAMANGLTTDLYDLKESRHLLKMQSAVKASSYQSQFSPDGKLFAWARLDGTIAVCDLERVNQELKTIEMGW
ncbi:MAG: hypothetical protein KDA84_10040, partial [Planctomycetaceae bacterium]|nr:hypothetical protein [Planctomycetaceae bacterium]